MNEQLNIFLKQIEHCSYGEKYTLWSQYLQKQSQADNYPYLLGCFLQYFPFNYRYWLEYIHLTKLEEYQTALLRNPKSYELWIGYLNNYKLTHEGDDPSKYKRELERAIIQIGADSRSLFLYEQYYEMVNQSVRFQFYKKVFTRALIGLEGLYDKFKEWFSSLTEQAVSALAIKQLKNAAATLNLEEQRTHLNNIIVNIYKKTLSYRDKRLRLQDQIKHNYFQGECMSKEKAIWRELISLERSNGIVQNISYCYQRSLMAQTDDVQLWQEVFHYMENQTNKYTKVLSILRNNKQFFLKFDINLYFYWCDLQERQNVTTARKMYQQQAKINNSYEVYERWIQLQIRQKQWNNAKLLYDNLITLYKQDIHFLAYILVQYSQFVVKYYKDFEYAKKLLKTYFDALPFNQYLLSRYLQFFKNFQNKQGYYDQLMQFINEAIVKAKNSVSQKEFLVMMRGLKYYLRSTLSSIYLIKLSERKMTECQQKLAKQS